MKKIWVGIFAILTLISCSRLNTGDLIGVYTFQGEEVSETLELKGGGVFTQGITISGHSFHASGEWFIQQSNQIRFRGFLVRIDPMTGSANTPPQEYDGYTGYWNGWQRRIVFDEDGKYFLSRSPK